MTRCLHQKLHWRWPGNPNGRTKCCNLRLLTFRRWQLTHQRLLRGWWRLLEMAQTAHSRRKKHRQKWSGSIEIPQTHKFMPTTSSKTSRRTSFCCYKQRRYWRHCALFFPTIIRQRLLFSPTKNNFSTTLTPTGKPRYTYCRVFVDSIYSKTIDIIREKNIFRLFLNRGPV